MEKALPKPFRELIQCPSVLLGLLPSRACCLVLVFVAIALVVRIEAHIHFYTVMRRVQALTGPYLYIVDSNVWWTRDTWLMFSIHAPGALIEIIPFSFFLGACLPVRPFRYRQMPKIRSFRFLRICLVTKGTNVLVCTSSCGVILDTSSCLPSALAARQS